MDRYGRYCVRSPLLVANSVLGVGVGMLVGVGDGNAVGVGVAVGAGESGVPVVCCGCST